MSTGTTVALVAGAGLAVGVVVWLVVHHEHQAPAKTTSTSKAVTAGDVIAGAGGAAVAALGKDLGSWAASGIKGLFD